MNDKIDFLKSIPYFNKWSRNFLSKFTYYFHEMKCIRNQKIFGEGDPSHLYVVLDGEFEITKKLAVK